MLRTLTLLSAALLASQVSHVAMAQDTSSDEVIQPSTSASVEKSVEESLPAGNSVYRRYCTRYLS